VLWDNFAVQHYGASDYHPRRRIMARATFFDPEVDAMERATHPRD
jgi:alpha-ketoglutarate-dependent taurine dioxygenase